MGAAGILTEARTIMTLPFENRDLVDLLIVGGGPAGLSAALAALDAGIESVAVVERRREWGRPVQCAEYVPRLLTRDIDIPSEAVARRVERLTFHCRGRVVGALAAPGFVLRRDVFEAGLARRAAEKGARLLQPASVVKIDDGAAVCFDGNRHAFDEGRQASDESSPRRLRWRLLIGADGPASLVRRFCLRRAGLPDARQPCAVGLQRALPWTPPEGSGAPGPLDPGAAEIHLDPCYGSGYGWRFPKDDRVNVGLALPPGRRRQVGPLFDRFLDQARRALGVDEAPFGAVGGLIPVGGPPERTVFGPVALCGDAAGQTHPLTGAGVAAAVVCGRMAGEAAATALKSMDLRRLERYEARWRSFLEAYLRRGLDASSRLEAAAGSPALGEFLEAARRAWGFRRSAA